MFLSKILMLLHTAILKAIEDFTGIDPVKFNKKIAGLL
jgi:hypothetical protein